MSFPGDIHYYVVHYGYVAVTLGILLEDFGLPTPGETLLLSAAALAARGSLDIWLLLALAWLAAVVGDNIGFAIGHFGGHRLVVRYGSRIGITEPRLQRVSGFFHRYGGAVIVFARFFVVLRQLNGIVAGTLEMHWLRFLLLNMLGAALWVGFWGMLAYWLGKRVFRLLHTVSHAEPLLIGGAVALIVLAVGGHYLMHRLSTRGDSQGPR